MRYLFISDVHGEYEKMIDALEAAKFDANKDTLVTVGDLFDRGSKSKEILEYVMLLPNYIPLWGNHDRRLKSLMINSRANKADHYNGVPATLHSFLGDILSKKNRNSPSDIMWMINILKTDMRAEKIKNLLWSYFDRCSYAAEFSDLVVTHAWIPTDYEPVYGGLSCKYWYNWRFASREHWDEALWSQSDVMLLCEANPPDKKMLVGHWHAWRIREFFLKEEIWKAVKKNGVLEEEICSPLFAEPVEYNNVIFIDGCVNISEGKVNVYVYESDKEPRLY